MKKQILSLLACSAMALQAGATTHTDGRTLTLGGYVGQRLHGVIERRVQAQDVDHLVEPFKLQDEKHNRWATEFWGKWIQGAVASYQYNHSPELLAKIEEGERKLIATQLPNGYIGDYPTELQLAGWDVWGRKYTLLGLYKCYTVTGHKEALQAACRLLDYTIAQLGPGTNKPIYKAGLYRGMPPLSILEPVTFLYRETGKKEYLQFAQLIAEQMNSPEGPNLIDKADVPVAERYVLKPGQEWWTWDNGQKGYEMMSCYIGLLEMYRLTAQAQYLQAALTTWNHIVREEINIAGGACSKECWYGGKALQAHPATHTMETCVTFTWMQFCERLLMITGDPKYVDQLERTMYNALLASTRLDNGMVAMYTPLEGYRRDGERQCECNMNCCNANAPRAYAMIPRVAYRTPTNSRIDVNLYIPSQANLPLGKRTFALEQTTNYPQDGRIEIAVSPDKAATATIALRIPAWAKGATAQVNGEAIQGIATGTYCQITRQWQKGDRITLTLDMQPRVCHLGHYIAYERGPVVFARDSRFQDGDVDEVVKPLYNEGKLKMEDQAPARDMWMTVSVPVSSGTYHSQPRDNHPIHLCDFASACANWDERIRYRVWLPSLYYPQNANTEKMYWE